VPREIGPRFPGPGCPRHGRVSGFLQPWLLLLLSRSPAHGYELRAQLERNEGAPPADPGLLYRTLRQMEHQGLVRSAWNTEGAGPARRVYAITPEGEACLHAWAERIHETRVRLDRFLQEYQAHWSGERNGDSTIAG